LDFLENVNGDVESQVVRVNKSEQLDYSQALSNEYFDSNSTSDRNESLVDIIGVVNRIEVTLIRYNELKNYVCFD
jgi:L-cysteine desulfidase